MARCWFIKDQEGSMLLENLVYHKDWRENTSVGAQYITLLELIEVLYKKGKHIECGTVVIAIGNSKAYNNIIRKIQKPSRLTQDSGAETARIKEIIAALNFKVQIELVKVKKGGNKPKATYQQSPLDHLIYECNKKAREGRESLHTMQEDTNIRFLGTYALKKGQMIISRSVKEAIRIIDAQEVENDYVQRKFGHQADFIDAEARAAFTTKTTTTSMIKCANAFNHYGVRDKMINNK